MTMSFQAHDGHAARSEDLHRHILRSHLAYLNQEETPAKLEQRRNLENLISEFLYVVSHNAKFTFIEVANILNCSVESNPNFSAYKAQSAFEALEKYATNLISHPWRKEYKTVKLYSGFYKHSVESQLVQGNSVFQLLGYQYTENGVLYLDEPVDPDKVARVALDCLTAYVECQVMVQICEKVKSFKCSWLEIHSIREDYVCSIDEAVRLLHQLKRNAIEQDKQSRWLRNQENGFSLDDKKESSSNYAKTGVLVDVSNTWPSVDDKFLAYNDNSLGQSNIPDGPYKPNKNILSHSKLPSWSEGVSSQLSDYHCNVISKSNEANYTSESFDDPVQSNYSFLNKSINPVSRYNSSNIIPDSWGDSWDTIQSPLQSGPPYHRNDSFVNCDLDTHRTGYNQAVPNVKEPYSSPFGHMYPPHPMVPLGIPAFPYPIPHDFTIPPRQCQCRICVESQIPIMTNKYHSKDSVSNNFESNFRSLGRQTTNQRDEPDVSASFSKLTVENSNAKSRNFPVNSPAYSSYQTVTESTSDVLRQGAEKSQHNNSKRASYYDNVPSTFENGSNTCVVGPSLNSKCDFQSNGYIPSNSLTLGKSRSQKTTSVHDSVSNNHSLKLQRKNSSNASPLEKTDTSSLVLNSDSKNIKSNQTATTRDSKGGKKWSCASCTFYNAADKSICDMCGRSKLPGPEITPLVSGGRECPQCTLVNKKDSENCTACGASLKDSPTYI